jgi:hypothetical protein
MSALRGLSLGMVKARKADHYWPPDTSQPSGSVSSITVMFMGGSTQLCYHCHEVTERTSDGDRVACSMCGRPYPIALPSSADAIDRPSAGLTSQDQTR